jgi:hypothetical protein
MQAFMLYMSGGGVQIFSMGIVMMLLLTPIKNLAGINDGMYFMSVVHFTQSHPWCFQHLRHLHQPMGIPSR